MIKLFIMDTAYAVDKMRCDKDFVKSLVSQLPSTWKKRIVTTKSEDLMHDRICAYLLLREVIEENGDLIFPETQEIYREDVNSDCDRAGLTFASGGRPSFLSADVDFSISHTDGAVAIAFSFNGRDKVGIDVEALSERTEDAAEKFVSRYMKNKNLKNGDLLFTFDFYDEREVSVYKLRDHGCERVSNLTLTEDTVTKQTPVKQWTSAEALLKCDGGGFASLPRIDEIKRKIAVDNGIVIMNGRKYCISVARSIEISPLIV